MLPPDGLVKYDDFLSNDSVADAAVGNMRWELVAIANVSTLANLVTTNTGVGQYGVLRMTTAATADGDGSVLRMDEDNIVLGGAGGRFGFKVRIPTAAGLTGNNFRIGLQDSVTATSPTVGIWVDCAAGVLSLQADSADHGDESVAADNDTLTSNTTMVLNTWYEFEVRWHGENAQGGPAYADLFIDGQFSGQTPCNIDDDEEMELSIAHWQSTGGADDLELDIDYIYLEINR